MKRQKRRRVREVTVSYFLRDGALISLHLEAVCRLAEPTASAARSCNSASHGWMQRSWWWSMYLHINQCKDQDCVDVQQILVNLCFLCQCVCYCCWRFDFSAVCLLMRGDLTDCPMWLILWQPPTPNTHINTQRTPFKIKEKSYYTKVAPAKVTQ